MLWILNIYNTDNVCGETGYNKFKIKHGNASENEDILTAMCSCNGIISISLIITAVFHLATVVLTLEVDTY